MNKILIFLSLALALTAQANAPRPQVCTTKDFKLMQSVWNDMEQTGFEKEISEQGIKITVGDCINAYSLETSAGRRHKMDAPKSFCGGIFILDSRYQAEQASWILDRIGKVYKTADGQLIKLCSMVSRPGPHPGVTVHN